MTIEYRSGGNPPTNPGLFVSGVRVAYWPSGYCVTQERVDQVELLLFARPSEVPLDTYVLSALFGEAP